MTTPNPRLVALATEFKANKDGLDYLDALAGTEGRDLTADERTAYDGACTRMDVIATEIAAVNERQKRFDAVAPVTATIDDAPVKTRTEHVEPRSPVTYTAPAPRAGARSVEDLGTEMLTRGRLRLGKIDENEASEILGRVVAHGVAADGTAPVTIEGDLIKFVDANRYAINASRQLPMPDNHAPTFKRPRVTQRTTVAAQATEGDILSSQRLQLTGDTVTKGTFGGVLALSEQEIDWTDPAMLGLAIQDLAESYAIATDLAHTAAIEVALTASTQTVVSNTADAATFLAAIATAAGTLYSNSKKLGDTYFVSIGRWSYLCSLVDGDGRPLFPMANPINPGGANGNGVTGFTGFNVLGLNVVVDPSFSANVHGIAVSSLVEHYEQNKGLLSINSPSTLEVQYAYRGYAASNVYTLGCQALETS